MAQEQQATTDRKLPAKTSVGEVRLKVSDLDRALAFYHDILGYQGTEAGERSVALSSSAGEVDFYLTEQPLVTPKPRRTSGLFHAAILLPSRPDLARVVYRLSTKSWNIGGASDHGVSEALYLDDPDGNGLEIYVDRPRDAWRHNGSQVVMVTEQLNFESLMAELTDHDASWDRIPEGTRIGHLHLQVGDLERSRQFYVDILGFDVMQDSYPGALFVAAGGYHHHIGMNTWGGRDVPRQPEDSAGLTRFTVSVPGDAGWQAALARLEAAGVPTVELDNDTVIVSDPDNIEVQLSRV